jgi:hypothetical protein
MLPVKRIDFVADKASFEVLILGSLGFSDRLIRRVTNLSYGQIAYRLRKQGISRRRYRDGLSPTADYVIRSSRKYVATEIDRQLRKMLKA